MTGEASGTPLLRNDRVLITLWTLPPETSTGIHRHAYDYAVLPLTTGSIRATASDGSTAVLPLAALEPYFRTAGVVHDVACDGSETVKFVEIELVGTQQGTMAPQDPS
jgi:quercetin dioxygenase-like cupin family protein